MSEYFPTHVWAWPAYFIRRLFCFLQPALFTIPGLIVRMAAGRSMTRQSPRDLRANAVVSISGDVNQGNPNLSPYFAHYFDFGTEWYIDENTLLAGSFFRKEVTGFIKQQTVRRPFSEAGIPLEILDGAQRAALTDGLKHPEFAPAVKTVCLASLPGLFASGNFRWLFFCHTTAQIRLNFISGFGLNI